jgi:hypothetical protein
VGLLARLAYLVMQVDLVKLERRAHRDRLDHKEKPEYQEPLDFQAFQEKEDYLVYQECLD